MMITIYGTSGCGFCRMAINKCKDLKLEHEYRDIGYKKWYKEFHALNVPNFSVPYIIADGVPIGHYGQFKEYVSELLVERQ